MSESDREQERDGVRERERAKESWVCIASNKFPKLMNIFLYNYYKFFEMIYDDYLNVVIQYFVLIFCDIFFLNFFFVCVFFYNSPCQTKKI